MWNNVCVPAGCRTLEQIPTNASEPEQHLNHEEPLHGLSEALGTVRDPIQAGFMMYSTAGVLLEADVS